MAQHWQVDTVAGGHVRLRSGRIGLVNVDVTAPVREGSFSVDDGGITLSLELALDALRTRAFLLQAAARTLVSRHQASILRYRGSGSSQQPWLVRGPATAGDITLELELTVTTWNSNSGDLPGGIELVGSANVGTVHLPLPGMGTVEDFSFDVDARLAFEAS